MSIRSLAVAQYILDKYHEHYNKAPISGLKLLKLVYFAHGFGLGFRVWLLNDESIMLGKYGPYIDSIYQNIRHYRNLPVTFVIKHNIIFNDDEKSIMNQIVNIYGRYNDLQLSTLAHKSGSPWDITRNLKIDAKTVSNDLLMYYFDNEIKEKKKYA